MAGDALQNIFAQGRKMVNGLSKMKGHSKERGETLDDMESAENESSGSSKEESTTPHILHWLHNGGLEKGQTPVWTTEKTPDESQEGSGQDSSSSGDLTMEKEDAPAYFDSLGNTISPDKDKKRVWQWLGWDKDGWGNYVELKGPEVEVQVGFKHWTTSFPSVFSCMSFAA